MLVEKYSPELKPKITWAPEYGVYSHIDFGEIEGYHFQAEVELLSVTLSKHWDNRLLLKYKTIVWSERNGVKDVIENETNTIGLDDDELTDEEKFNARLESLRNQLKQETSEIAKLYSKILSRFHYLIITGFKPVVRGD